MTGTYTEPRERHHAEPDEPQGNEADPAQYHPEIAVVLGIPGNLSLGYLWIAATMR